MVKLQSTATRKKTEQLLKLIVICARYITSQWESKKGDDEVLHLVCGRSRLACLRVNELKWALYGWVGRYPEVNHWLGTISGLFRPTFPKI